MSQPVKLSDDLVLDARLAGELLERSIAGQIEFWAQLGREVTVIGTIEAVIDEKGIVRVLQRRKARSQ